VLAVGNATGRRSVAASVVIIAIPITHIGVLVAAETLVRIDLRLLAVVGLLVLAEFAAGIALIQRRHRGKRVLNFAAFLPRRTGEAAVAT
jgi:lipopolysaccharide export system permease protein